MMIRHVTILASFAMAAGLHAQDKMGLVLRSFVGEHRGSGEVVDLYVHGEKGCVTRAVRELGGTIKMTMPGLVSAHLPVDVVDALAGRHCVTGFEFNMDAGMALNDSARAKSRIDLVQQGLVPLPMPYDGEGVIVGIIDTGSDFRHDDFKHADGRTRVLKYWDHYCSTNPGLIPAEYGYGQEFDSAMINAGTFPLCPPNLDHQFGHGTTVMGAAASNGNASGRYIGGAPGADLIVVSSKLTLPNWRATIADAVKYILDQATAMGRPCVINCSLGSYTGSHDGKDATALFIDSMLNAAPGRILVCAGGNSGQFQPYHMRTEVGSDTTFTWFQWEGSIPGGNQGIYFDLWSDSVDFANVHFAVGADRVIPDYQYRGRTSFHTVQLDSLITDTLWSFDGNRLGIVNYFAEMRGDQVHMETYLLNPDSASYYYRFMTTGSGVFDTWSMQSFLTSDMITAIPDAVDFPPIVNYVLPDIERVIVDSWACSPSVITVANMNNEMSYVAANDSVVVYPDIEGNIAASSSAGPTRDGRVKPDLAAPGDITLSAAPPALLASYLLSPTNIVKLSSDSLHLRNGGTSMASPVVAGAVALFLQRCPYAYPDDVIAAFNSTAAVDAFTGAVPNGKWGHGKLDAFAAMVGSLFTYDPGLAVLGPLTFCPEDSVLVEADPTFDLYFWSDGGTYVPPNVGSANAAGPFSVIMANAQGCIAYSDTVVFSTYPPATVPVISQVGNTLESTPADAYQWFFEGGAIGGANAQTYDVTTTGTYAVEITDGNGCNAMSDTLFVLVTGVEAPEPSGGVLSCWPSPVDEQLFIGLPSSNSTTDFHYVIIDDHGRTVREGEAPVGSMQIALDVRQFAAGVYSLQLDQGAEWHFALFMVR